MYPTSKRLNEPIKTKGKEWAPIGISFHSSLENETLPTSMKLREVNPHLPLVCQSGLIGVSEKNHLENMDQSSVTPDGSEN